jgi:hypothetical protein
MDYIYISIGKDCLPAKCLDILKLRKISMPFDWLSISPKNSFEYINDLIETRFFNFTNDLEYNINGRVISKHYPYIEFFHHDLLKNIVIGRAKDDDKNLIETMNRRADRFINIIENISNRVIFIYHIENNNFKKYSDKLFKDMKDFNDNKNVKCTYKIIVLVSDNDDFNLDIPDKFHILEKFNICKYIKNSSIHGMYGNKYEFLDIIRSIEI